MPNKDRSAASERRQYIRLDTVLPVQFMLMGLDGKSQVSQWMQGFTNNVGKGGICLRVNNLPVAMAEMVKARKVKFSLEIEMPFSTKPMDADAQVAWVQDVPEGKNRYLIGLSYTRVSAAGSQKLMNYAKARRVFLPAVVSVISALIIFIAASSYMNYQLVRGNKALVEQLVSILQDSAIAKEKIKNISKEREDFQLKIQALEVRINKIGEERDSLSEKVKQEEAKAIKKTEELNTLVDKLVQEKAVLQEKVIGFQDKENKVAEELLRLNQKRVVLEKANLDKMYRWLVVHQNPRLGLVMSFEGDSEVANWAFTYDQSLAVQAYTNFSDFERAGKILDFYQKKAKRANGLFLNAYYVPDGSPAEYTVHAGPNIWLGIAAAQYIHKTKDNKYLSLAEDIGEAIIELQNEDNDGGLRGGPSVQWYATEHNLDAYAFFDMLYKITSKETYAHARDKVLSWLLLHTYDRSDVPIMRGKGDSTIATDTYAWSIAAIGPQKLEELGMNPDKIMEFAEEHCGVEVSYVRPEGKVIKIKGFDFAPQRHVARGGVVSSEWTAQMVISFKMMSDYYHRKGLLGKSRIYQDKADDYLLQLCNMIISSPSPSGQGEGCLPYATADYVDTGHGWMTPKGKATGSVSGTAYTIFAYSNYNPLELSE